MTDSLTRCFFEAIQNEEDLPDLGKASSVCEKFVKAVGVYMQASGSFDKQLFILKETMVKTIDMRSLKPFLTGRAESREQSIYGWRSRVRLRSFAGFSRS